MKRKNALKLNGAEILVEALKLEGVEHIFGYPGGAVLNIYDALYKQNAIQHILARHEQAAVHEADGYARASGKVGVALVTSGPGLTNAVTGIATAYMDSIPLVVFSGQVPSSLIGNDAFQEVDAVGITRPCVKHNYLVKDVKDLALTIKKAFYIARSGRPGPVLVDIPKDVSAALTEFYYPETIEMRSYNATIKGHMGQIKRALRLLLKAERPVFYVGGGAVLDNASDYLIELAQKLNIPVTNTLMGLGVYPGNDRQFIGMLGMHGSYEANKAMHEADVIFAIGARFDDRVTGNVEKFSPNAKFIHIDIDPSSIAKNVNVDVPIVGSVKSVLNDMLGVLADQPLPPAERLNQWWNQINQWRKVESFAYEHSDTVIKPQSVIETLYELTQGRAILSSDVGQHQMWAAQLYRFHKPRTWINSGGLGTMGFGFPAAIGAKIACPDEDVFCITGDGSIQMMLQELATARQYSLPIKILCLNNGYLGMVRQWQELFYDKRYSMTYLESAPNFIQLTEAYGHCGMVVERPDQLKAALQKAIDIKDKVVFLDIHTDPSENVYPMIPTGGGQDDMLLGGREEGMQSHSDKGMVLV